jgi:diguanylate cyclase (GGDEF)-like protein/PAS domain S-box-containing protein
VTIARPDRAFFLIGLACALAYVSLPRDSALYDRWYQLFHIAAVVATIVGVTINRPRSRVPWYLVAAGGLCAIAADAVYTVYAEEYDTVPFPSIADFLSLSSYVVLAAALLLMIRQQAPGRDWPTLIDAGIVTVGVSIVSWTFVMQPRLSPDSTALETAVALAFPVMDVLLVSVAARMMLGSGARSPAFVMVVTALVFQLAGDALYGFGSLHGWYELGDPVDMFFVLSAVLWGTAALHPSMVDLTEPNPDPETRLSGKRLLALSASTLMAPAMLAVAAVRDGSTELLVIVGAATTLSALVIVRLGGLVARHDRAERREHALREAGVALVAAWRPEEIYRVAVESALEIVGSEGASAGFALGRVDDFRVVAAVGARPELLLELGPGDVTDTTAAELARRFPEGPPTVRIPSKTGEWTLVSVAVQDTVRGAIVTHSLRRLSRYAREGLETLATQIALGLEGAALAADLHTRQSSERFRSLVQNSSDVIALLEPDLTIRYHTPSVERVLGYAEDELVGVRLDAVLGSEDGNRLREFYAGVCAAPGVPTPRDLLLRRKDGSHCQLESVFNNLLHDENVAGVVVTARDVTERRALEEQLSHQAFHDSLTGLANRALFSDRVSHALELTRRSSSLVGVLFVDLDDFKTVNDSLGHAAGDELLVSVASRLEGSLREEDTCARLGGDEFAVIVESVEGPEDAVVVARRVLDAISEPIHVFGSEVSVQASVGIALGSSGVSTSEVLRNADLAMYRAKSEGKSRYALFEPAMHVRVLERLALKAELQRAVTADEFELHYQPIVALQSGVTVGVEALVRWRHPDRGLLLPDGFVPLAEETGLILPLGRFVLHSACRQARRWRGVGYPDLGVSVNISAKQLASPHLPAEVTSALAESSLEPSALTLEITESMLLDSEPVIARLEALKQLGVRIAIDDFGTGYSSLNYLRRFPVDTLKIAKPFVDEISSRPDQQRLVAAILRLGATLGLETVAEGIEEAPQRDLLRKLRCRYGQGFFFSRPLPADELDSVLRRALVA